MKRNDETKKRKYQISGLEGNSVLIIWKNSESWNFISSILINDDLPWKRFWSLLPCKKNIAKYYGRKREDVTNTSEKLSQLQFKTSRWRYPFAIIRVLLRLSRVKTLRIANDKVGQSGAMKLSTEIWTLQWLLNDLTLVATTSRQKMWKVAQILFTDN